MVDLSDRPYPDAAPRFIAESPITAVDLGLAHPLPVENYNHPILADPNPNREHSRPRKTPAT